MKYEKIRLIITIIFCICILICTGYWMGKDTRSNRIQRARITELERTIADQQREFEASIRASEDRCQRIIDNSEAAERLVASMGEQLEYDAGNINDTVQLIRQLRIQIELLQDCYADSRSCYNSIVMGE